MNDTLDMLSDILDILIDYKETVPDKYLIKVLNALNEIGDDFPDNVTDIPADIVSKIAPAEIDRTPV